jgi:hypothetical protein
MRTDRNLPSTRSNPGDKSIDILKAREIFGRITGRRAAGKLGDRTPLIQVHPQRNQGFQVSPLLLLLSFSFILL